MSIREKGVLENVAGKGFAASHSQSVEHNQKYNALEEKACGTIGLEMCFNMSI
jgi:hypothetical protein